MIGVGVRGLVTDIKHFAVHDGKGIRTTVFLKGCPLSCRWCHNPESIGAKPQLGYYSESCVGCGMCASVCPVGAHTVAGGVHHYDRIKCTLCGACTGVCRVNALHLYGKTMTVDEVLDTVEEDRVFYEQSGGGMTLSGGEPTQQSDFALALLREAKMRGLHTALDTCGMAATEKYEALLPNVDQFLFDVKHIDAAAHKAGTGVTNERILGNLRYLSDHGAEIEIRIPLIPGYNDADDVLDAIGAMLSGIRCSGIRVLPYHDYAGGKYSALGMENTLPQVDVPTEEHMRHCREHLAAFGLPVIDE
ncbi:MAG: glycyl-radical enzyme activating protein [Clostridia bacterium]|nr:glycyl-radical enzyme activating protein [Clostridia bacterium]